MMMNMKMVILVMTRKQCRLINDDYDKHDDDDVDNDDEDEDDGEDNDDMRTERAM